MKKIILLFPLSFFLLFSNLKAQELETILLAKEDAQKITNAYLNPAMKGLIYSMNNGWYHTAKVHKKFGFDVTIGFSGSFFPEKERIFNIMDLNLSKNSSVVGNVKTSPTIAGSKNIAPAKVRYSTTIQGQEVSQDFELPKGAKEDFPISAVPAPSIQIGVGLPFKFDAMLRFTPKVGNKDVKGSLFGIGVKKEITSWFGPIDKTPLHISLLAAYTNMNVDYAMEGSTGKVATKNAAAEFKLNSYTVQAIASLNFPVINVYGGIGYNGGSTNLNMVGTYILSYDTGIPATPKVEESVTNPFKLKSKASGINATLGARLSLGFFKLFGSYTIQEYNSLNAGIAFSFR